MTVSGTRSEPSSRPPFDPPADRGLVRISNVYATGSVAAGGDEPTAHLRLGRLARYYEHSATQLSRVVSHRSIAPQDIAFSRWKRPECVRAASSWLFVLSTGQVAAALTLDVDCELVEAVDLLEDCYYEEVTVGGRSLGATLLTSLSDGEEPELLPERHQLVFIPGQSAASGRRLPFNKSGIDEDEIQRVIYRADLPYRPEYSAIAYPPELNRRPSSAAAVGPYVSLLGGQQDYVENAALLSAVQAVASAARLREIRADAYETVGELDAAPEGLTLTERRHRLERAADTLGRMEVDLSRGVEAPADLGLLVPSLRVSNFHTTLFGCMCLTEQASTVARMISRLERAIAAELTSILSAERRADDRRRVRWTVTVGFITTIAVPVTLVFAFFGINAREVDADASIFDGRYVPVYLLTAMVILTTVTLFAGLYIQHRTRDRGTR